MPKILYLCDHNYDCINSLFCEVNGGFCKHTSQFSHSRNKPHITDISEDDRFERVETGTEDAVRYEYWEWDTEPSQEKQLPL